MTDVKDESPAFAWNAEEALKLLNRGYRIVLTQDGLGDITALAIPKDVTLDYGLEAWRDFGPPCETLEDMQRSVLRGSEQVQRGRKHRRASPPLSDRESRLPPPARRQGRVLYTPGI